MNKQATIQRGPTYKIADWHKPGHSCCLVGYEDCPIGHADHWHCSNCGGIAGSQGHYFNPDGKGWRFTCYE